MHRLEQGDLLPKMSTSVPGPKSIALSEEIRQLEAPGINTLYNDRPNIFWHSALGSNVLDVDGNRYIDLTSGFGVAALGHRHPKVVQAINHQSEVLVHGLGDAIGHPLRLEVAKRLKQISPIKDTRVYFAISGSDAVEIAVKTALLYQARETGGSDPTHRILAFDPSYHGLTLGALNLSSRRPFKDPFSAHLHSRVHRLPFATACEDIESVFRQFGDFAAVILEPIVGREGILIPEANWLADLAEVCRRFGVLLIADEIFTGFGRTGRWWTMEHESTVPDLICCGKAMANGMPIAAVLASKHLMGAWRAPGEARHTATFVAHPLACAAAVITLDTLKEEQLPQRADRLGTMVYERLRQWPARFQDVRAVRGRGLLWGIEIASSELGSRFCAEAWSRGILLLVGGPEGRVAQLVPPLTITEAQLDHSLNVLEDALLQLAGS